LHAFGTGSEAASLDLEIIAQDVPGFCKDTISALKELHKKSRSGTTRFSVISFQDARFYEEANFSYRSFNETANFTGARFYSPPNFDNVDNASQIDFTGAHIGFVPPGKLHWTSKTEVPNRLRAVRKIAEETKNHDLERDLYIEERKAERGVYLVQWLEDLLKDPVWKWPGNAMRLMIHILWLAVMGVYWLLADYGRSFALPAAWLALSVSIFRSGYDKVLAPLMREAGPANADRYNHAVGILALGNAVPFVGPLTIDAEIKKFLFCPGSGNCLPIPPEGYQLLVLGQNLVSITLVFFIGLASHSSTEIPLNSAGPLKMALLNKAPVPKAAPMNRVSPQKRALIKLDSPPKAAPPKKVWPTKVARGKLAAPSKAAPVKFAEPRNTASKKRALRPKTAPTKTAPSPNVVRAKSAPLPKTAPEKLAFSPNDAPVK
jgi:hypothetical protein